LGGHADHRHRRGIAGTIAESKRSHGGQQLNGFQPSPERISGGLQDKWASTVLKTVCVIRKSAGATAEELTKLTIWLDAYNVTGIGSALDNPY
jgi:hypothetical protein